jgi:ParB/RepB/Spo0J family partition protein
MSREVVNVPLEEIDFGEEYYNRIENDPYRDGSTEEAESVFEEDDVETEDGFLQKTIKWHGLNNPIILRKKIESENGKHYKIIAGHRRFLAVKALGHPTIPAIVRDCDDKEALKLSLTDNLASKQLSPLERAIAARKLYNCEFPIEEIAAIFNRSERQIRRSLRAARAWQFAEEHGIDVSALNMKHLAMFWEWREKNECSDEQKIMWLKYANDKKLPADEMIEYIKAQCQEEKTDDTAENTIDTVANAIEVSEVNSETVIEQPEACDEGISEMSSEPEEIMSEGNNVDETLESELDALQRQVNQTIADVFGELRSQISLQLVEADKYEVHVVEPVSLVTLKELAEGLVRFAEKMAR